MNQSPSTVALNFSYLSIIFLNGLNYISPIPISIQLFFIPISCIYIGSRRGIIIQEKFDKGDDEKERSDKMTYTDAVLFLVWGSAILLGLYFAFEIFDKKTLNYILVPHFTFFGVLSLIQLFCYHLDRYNPPWSKAIIYKKKFNINLYFYKKNFTISIYKNEIIAGLIAFPATVGYLMSKNWILNNLFGVAFSICGVESLVLPSFQIGTVLLFGMFCYDIFWVYGTDVMYTVAKSVDGPIKLLFPVNLNSPNPAFSMLGLGDIIIPGIFIALCLKFDVDRAIVTLRKQGIKEFNFDIISTPYFHWCLGGYALGIILTYNALLFFDKAQPALLFLVPCCLLSVLICAWKNREVKKLLDYSEDQLRLSIETPFLERKEKRGL